MSDENFIESFTINYIEGQNINLEVINNTNNLFVNVQENLLMGFKCPVDCNHGSCLSYLFQNIWENKVYQFTYLVNSKKVFGKVIKRKEYERYQTNRNILPRINEMLPNLDHQNIMKYYGLSYFSDKMILFGEFMSNGSLRKKIKPNVPFNIDMIYGYCKDILEAIKFLHDKKILHRFIHPHNIYIDNNGGYKLAISIYSYSLADGDVQIDDEWLKNNETHSKKYYFHAPELVIDGTLSYPYDIFFFVCTVIEMLTGPENNVEYNSITIDRMKQNLQRKNDEMEQNLQRINDEMEQNLQRINDEMEQNLQRIKYERLKSFIGRMLKENPTQRATANQLLRDDFITNNNNQSI